MNYLAHAYLSFNDPETLVGNLTSDFIKGKKKFDYPPGIQKGITLHRMIDTFTDEHETTKEAKNIFRPAYRLYSGAFTDVVYDHFLATDENEFTESSLFDFTQQVYVSLAQYKQWFPEKFTGMFPYMQSHNWLFNYRTKEGTGKSLQGVVRRSAYLTESKTAYDLFEQHYQLFRQCYRQFWKDLKPYAKKQYELLKEIND
ncbi:MAG: ACP phosphodiesterase [Chitinophagaceae bacterium]